MSAPLTRAAYAELLRAARRHARRADEAEDLLHDALLAMLGSGEPPGDERAWLHGVMRNRALMQARAAVRRRRREAQWQAQAGDGEPAPDHGPNHGARLPADLPPSLRAVLLLALTGHSRAEIRHLLRLSDEALRQRIAMLRRRIDGSGMPAEPLLAGPLAFGSLRRGLLPVVRRFGHLATHDPDGHGIVVGFSSGRAHERPAGGN